MSQPPQTVEYWRQRSEEARRQAQETKDAGAKQALLKIAELCDQLAQEAEK
jgi:hypothetical protein